MPTAPFGRKQNAGAEMSITEASPDQARYRWLQLIAGIICMVMVANLQYGWTYFVDPMKKAQSWDREAIQWAFTLFVFVETFLVPIEGWFVDRFGPRVVVAFGGIVVAIAWTINSMATTIPILYLGNILAGVGAGAVYGTCVGNALKWFPDRRGLAAGLTAMGFGAGSALSVAPIIYVIKTYGYQSAFLWFGLGQGGACLLLSWVLKAPPARQTSKAAPRLVQTLHDYTPLEMLKTPLFYVMYVMFVLVAASGLVVTAQVNPIANDYGVADTPVWFLFTTSTVIVTAGIVDNILNGVARPTFGWLSDYIGRENTMAIVFTCGAVAYWALGTSGTSPYVFILTAGLVYFTWGEIYSLFPATCTDSYGAKYATTNAGLLYTAKGAAAFLVPLANWLQHQTGSWHSVFIVATIANLAVAACALFVLKPMRARQLAGLRAQAQQMRPAE